jgi:ABC-type multidrug transport system permease subunit
MRSLVLVLAALVLALPANALAAWEPAQQVPAQPGRGLQIGLDGRGDGVLALLAFASIGLGLLVSSTARSEGQIFPFIPAVVVPSLLLSGLLIPFAELSAPLQVLGRLVPLSYAEDVLVPIFRDGEPVAGRLPYLGLLALYGIALVAIASLTLRERD